MHPEGRDCTKYSPTFCDMLHNNRFTLIIFVFYDRGKIITDIEIQSIAQLYLLDK